MTTKTPPKWSIKILRSNVDFRYGGIYKFSISLRKMSMDEIYNLLDRMNQKGVTL